MLTSQHFVELDLRYFLRVTTIDSQKHITRSNRYIRVPRLSLPHATYIDYIQHLQAREIVKVATGAVLQHDSKRTFPTVCGGEALTINPKYPA